MESTNRDVAIIGMSGVFPEADSLEQLYHNLRNKRDSVRKISDTRIIHSCLDPANDYQLAGHLERVDAFDYKFFNLSKREADMMAPSQRILLELACEAIENAGYRLGDFSGSNTAVYLGGQAGSHYAQLAAGQDAIVIAGNLHALEAGRVAYVLNLRGPAMMIDTTCSSSLVAVHEACQKLIYGEVDYALAGGVNIKIAFDEKGYEKEFMGVGAPDGKCKSFDAAANGIGSGEGGGIVVSNNSRGPLPTRTTSTPSSRAAPSTTTAAGRTGLRRPARWPRPR